MRTVRCVKEIQCEYLTVGVEYTLCLGKDEAAFQRVVPNEDGFHSGTFMRMWRFKQALKNKELVFTD